MHNSGAWCREIAESYSGVIASNVIACDKREAFALGSEATKQSILSSHGEMDCFAEPVIGQRFAPPRWLAMTSLNSVRFGCLKCESEAMRWHADANQCVVPALSRAHTA
jgi:hypothetical protein